MSSRSQRDLEAERAFVEEFARALEDNGICPRIAGRIMGLLHVTPEPHLSQAELAAQLDVSLASVSAMTRLLCGLGWLERVAVPGERRERYAIGRGGATAMAERSLAAASRYTEIVDRALQLPGQEGGVGRGQLREFHEFCLLTSELMSRLLGEWERRRSRPSA